MTEDDWTPAKGYMKAGCHLAVRTGINITLSVIACLGFAMACDSMGLEAINFMLPVAAGAAVGAAEGCIQGMRVSSAAGLSGRPLLMPALALFGGAQYVAFRVALVYRPGWNETFFFIIGMTFALGMAMTLKYFLTDN